MKLATTALTLSWVSFVAANFDIYLGVEHIYFDAIRTPIIQIFDADPDCDNVEGAKQYVKSGTGDVSSGIGYRCEGECSAGGRADGIEELEMAFSEEPHYHFTIYKERNWDLEGTDGNVYGNCFPFPDNSYNCAILAAAVQAERKFRCITHLTAEQIQAAD